MIVDNTQNCFKSRRMLGILERPDNVNSSNAIKENLFGISNIRT